MSGWLLNNVRLVVGFSLGENAVGACVGMGLSSGCYFAICCLKAAANDQLSQLDELASSLPSRLLNWRSVAANYRQWHVKWHVDLIESTVGELCCCLERNFEIKARGIQKYLRKIRPRKI